LGYNNQKEENLRLVIRMQEESITQPHVNPPLNSQNYMSLTQHITINNNIPRQMNSTPTYPMSNNIGYNSSHINLNSHLSNHNQQSNHQNNRNYLQQNNLRSIQHSNPQINQPSFQTFNYSNTMAQPYSHLTINRTYQNIPQNYTNSNYNIPKYLPQNIQYQTNIPSHYNQSYQQNIPLNNPIYAVLQPNTLPVPEINSSMIQTLNKKKRKGDVEDPKPNKKRNQNL